MAGLSAVIFLPDDTGKTGYTRPMLLGNLMGAPLLAWLVDSLSAGGVERFFLVCRPPWEAAARACFPADTQLVVAEESQASEQIQVFLSAAGDEQSDVIVVTGPCVLLPYDAEILALDGAPEPSNLLCVKKTAFQAAVEAKADLLEVLKDQSAPYTDRDGAFSITSLAQLTDFQPPSGRSRCGDLGFRHHLCRSHGPSVAPGRADARHHPPGQDRRRTRLRHRPQHLR